MFYGPIGLISLIVLHFRLIFHKICTGKYDWDADLSLNFVTFIKELKVLEGVPVSRHVLCK